MEYDYRFRGGKCERIACAAHGALAVLHLLGVAYHVQRPRRLSYAVVHAAAAAFDIVSTFKHGRG